MRVSTHQTKKIQVMSPKSCAAIAGTSTPKTLRDEPHNTATDHQPRRIDLCGKEQDERHYRDQCRDRIEDGRPAKLPGYPGHERQGDHVHPIEDARQDRRVPQAGDKGASYGDKDKSRQKDTYRGQERSWHPIEYVTYKGGGSEDRAGSNLAYGHGVYELLVAQEAWFYKLRAKKGQKHVATAEEHRPGLQKRQEDSEWSHGCPRQRQER